MPLKEAIKDFIKASKTSKSMNKLMEQPIPSAPGIELNTDDLENKFLETSYEEIKLRIDFSLNIHSKLNRTLVKGDMIELMNGWVDEYDGPFIYKDLASLFYNIASLGLTETQGLNTRDYSYSFSGKLSFYVDKTLYQYLNKDVNINQVFMNDLEGVDNEIIFIMQTKPTMQKCVQLVVLLEKLGKDWDKYLAYGGSLYNYKYKIKDKAEFYLIKD